MKLKNIIRYGTSKDTKFLKEYIDTYDLITFNANMICHASQSISELMYTDFIGKDFFIDPKLYTFQISIDNIKSPQNTIKSSYIQLASEYNLSYVLQNETALTTKTILEHGIENLANDILSFQYNYLHDNLNSDLKSLVEFSSQYKRPSLLVAPSFALLNDDYQEWLSINANLLQTSLQQKNRYDNLPIYVTLIVTKKLLVNQNFIKDILKSYQNADGILFWIDDFNELTVETESIMALINFIQQYKLLNPTKELYSLYGGFFSQLLGHLGLTGSCHSVAYGESRKITSSGGKPIHKYYMPHLYQRMKPEEMIKLLQELNIKTNTEFFDQICNCSICQKNILDNDINKRFFVYLDDLDANILTRQNAESNNIGHYLKVKQQEFETLNKENFETILRNLANTYNKFHSFYSLNDISYLTRWKECLQSTI